MADPFSLASGAIGVISLGLTICDAIISYTSAFKEQHQYLDILSGKAEGLSNCLRLLSQALPALRTRTPDIARQIDSSLAECSAHLVLLDSKIASLRCVQGPSLSRDKFRHATQKALLPFKKDVLVEMSGTIDSLQRNLDTILAIASVYVKSIGRP